MKILAPKWNLGRQHCTEPAAGEVGGQEEFGDSQADVVQGGGRGTQAEDREVSVLEGFLHLPIFKEVYHELPIPC